jgi:hypothetical protein
MSSLPGTASSYPGILFSSRLPDVVPITKTAPRGRREKERCPQLAVPHIPPAGVSSGTGAERPRPVKPRRFRLNIFSNVAAADADRSATGTDSPATDADMSATEADSSPTEVFRSVGRLLRSCARSLEEDDLSWTRSGASSSTTALCPAAVLVTAVLNGGGLLTAGIGALFWVFLTATRKK